MNENFWNFSLVNVSWVNNNNNNKFRHKLDWAKKKKTIFVTYFYEHKLFDVVLQFPQFF